MARVFLLVVFGVLLFGCVSFQESYGSTDASPAVDSVLTEYQALLEKGKAASYSVSYKLSGAYFESPGGLASFAVFQDAGRLRADYGKKDGSFESAFFDGGKSVVCNSKCSESSFGRDSFEERRPDRYFDRELAYPTSGGDKTVSSSSKVVAGVNSRCFIFESVKWRGVHCLEESSGVPLYFEVRDSSDAYSGAVMQATSFSKSVSEQDFLPRVLNGVSPGVSKDGNPSAKTPSNEGFGNSVSIGGGVESGGDGKGVTGAFVNEASISIQAAKASRSNIAVKHDFLLHAYPEGDVYLVDKWTVIQGGQKAFVDALNKERLKYGLPALTLSDTGIAQVKAEDLVARNYFAHRSPAGFAGNWNYAVSPTLLYSTLGGADSLEENDALFSCSTGELSGQGGYDSVQSEEGVGSSMRHIVNSFIYDDAESSWGHRDSLLSPCNNVVDVGMTWNATNDRGFATCRVAAHLQGKHVKWVKPPKASGGVFQASGFVDKGYSFKPELNVFFASSSDVEKMVHEYSLGDVVAGVATGNFVFSGVNTIKASKFDYRESDGFFDVEFTLDLPQKQGEYSVVLFGSDLSQVKHPFKQDWDFTCPLFKYAFPVNG